nr:GMC family oxidoreductase N-terminal domain-containing protein [Mangrovicoccus ximenensis]
MEQFDYIVIGGGSSGCVMAARLSEDPKAKVLLIESGQKDKSPFIHIPATFFKVVEKGRDVVLYTGEPSDKVNGRNSYVLQGHVIGGSSSVNAMIYIRGQSGDYDAWAQDGNRGWSYGDVLPVFRALESNMEIADGFHGSEGPLRVSETAFHHPLSRAFIRAAQQAGLPYNPDFNGAVQEGAGFYQTTTHDGRRWSAAMAFLRDAENRPNLKIMTETRVARVLLEDGRATGVELEDGRRARPAAVADQVPGPERVQRRRRDRETDRQRRDHRIGRLQQRAHRIHHDHRRRHHDQRAFEHRREVFDLGMAQRVVRIRRPPRIGHRQAGGHRRHHVDDRFERVRIERDRPGQPPGDQLQRQDCNGHHDGPARQAEQRGRVGFGRRHGGTPDSGGST